MPDLRVTGPLGYLEFLNLMANARLVLTDSGGIQEETTILGVLCLTLRENTERPVTVTQGTNTIVGHDPYVREADWRRALGDGVDVPLAENLWEALRGADCVALVTRHREYQALDLQGMKDAMRTPVLVDGRDVFDPVRCAKVGFVMRTVGKG